MNTKDAYVSVLLRQGRTRAAYFGVAVFTLILLLAMGLSSRLQEAENSLIRELVRKETNSVAKLLESNLKETLVAQRRMAQRFEVTKGERKDLWLHDARNYVDDFTALKAVEWVDATYHIRWLEPIEGNEAVIGLNVAYDDERLRLLEEARDAGDILVTPPLVVKQGYRAFIAYVPMYVEGDFAGFMVGVYDADVFFQTLLSEKHFSQFSIHVQDEGRLVYESQTSDIAGEHYDDITAYHHHATVKQHGVDWNIEMHATGEFVAAQKTAWPIVVLGAGLLVALMGGIVSYMSLLLERRNEILGENTVQLKEEQERFRNVIENAVDGLITIDERGIIENVNPSMLRIFGYEREEMIGKNVKMLMPEPIQTEHDEYLARYKTTGNKFIIGIGREVEAKRKDGTVFPIDLSISEMVLSGQRKFSGIIRDITMRKLNESLHWNILENKHAFSGILEFFNQPHKTTEIMLEGFMLTLLSYDWLGLERCGAVYLQDEKGNLRTASYVPLEDETGKVTLTRDLVFEQLALEGKSTIFACALDDVPQTVEQGGQYAVPIHYEHKVIGVVSVLLGVDRKHDEEKVHFLENVANILGTVIARKQYETQRETLIEELADSNEELERFAYVCSHDLREPMRIMKGFSERLEKYLGAKAQEDEKLKKYLHYITDAATRAQTLIQDILAYSRVEKDMQQVEIIDTQAMLDSIILDFTAEEGGKPKKITAHGLPKLVGHQTQVYQLLQNLVSNGLKYQPADRVPEVTVTAQEQGDQWLFCVEDNGIGIELRHLTKIFEVFQRLHDRSEYSGTGIGLAICKKIVEMHGGEIWVESEPGTGSQFYFTLSKHLHQD